MSDLHSNCVPKAMYWSVVNKMKYGDSEEERIYIKENNRLRNEIRELKNKIYILENSKPKPITKPDNKPIHNEDIFTKNTESKQLKELTEMITNNGQHKVSTAGFTAAFTRGSTVNYHQ
tara:strand:+ start:150 stop:506 length:357 start_codon:yes stop_codon:yes gene_type:complete